jgi:hypothetical protein
VINKPASQKIANPEYITASKYLFINFLLLTSAVLNITHAFTAMGSRCNLFL